MAVETPAWADQASSYNAEQTRRAVFFGATSGVKGTGDLAVTAPVSGMSVNVAAGEVLIPGSSSPSQGLYYGRNGATVNLTIAAANPSNPRIDMVCATVDDAAYAGGANDWKLQVLTGTPTAGATLTNLSGAPALPASSLILAYVLVPASASNIVSADVGDKRVRASTTLLTPAALLGVHQYAPGTLTSDTINSATLAALDTTNAVTPSFTAPASGQVLVKVAGTFWTSDGTTIFFALFSHGTTTQVGFTTATVNPTVSSSIGFPPVTFLVSGLTPGSTYQFDLAWATTGAGTTATWNAKGFTGTGTTAASPLVVEVWSA